MGAVAILMGVCGGEAYLPAQLASILRQTVTDWDLWLSDDSPGTGARDLLTEFGGNWEGRLHYLRGPRRGVVPNFLGLACRPDISAEFYAFSDQDDVWDPDRLQRALARLASVPASVPALYCSRTRLVDADGRPIGLSPLFARPPSFANALVQSIAGGNTMVFNQAARALLMAAGDDVDVVVHDWWLYLLVTGAGGVVIYDEVPSLSYRQHGGNLIGGARSLSAWGRRMLAAFGQSDFRGWVGRNLAALERNSGLLTDRNRAALACFAASRRCALPGRLAGFRRVGIHRQTAWGNLGLWVAAVLGKI